MPDKPLISILICTRNRAESLRVTLAALQLVTRPNPTELIVIDNASGDQTPPVIPDFKYATFPAQYLFEPSPGQCFARNAGMAAAKGDIVVFTDDDVAPAADWLARLTAPLLENRLDAVVGRVVSAPHLLRPWMTPMHRAMLAESITLDPHNPEYLIGANLAFHRRVLEMVPAFDTQLGPGARGFGDDYLFSLQLRRAGFRLGTAFDAIIEHHFDADRLLRRNWLQLAAKQGRTNAYLAHHWEHKSIPRCRLHALARRARLAAWRASHLHRARAPQGAAPRELEYLRSFWFYQAFLAERHSCRNYSQYGLRMDAPIPGPPAIIMNPLPAQFRNPSHDTSRL